MGVLKPPFRKWYIPVTKCPTFHCSAVRLFVQETYNKAYQHEFEQKLSHDLKLLLDRSPPLLHQSLRLGIYFQVLDLCAESFEVLIGSNLPQMQRLCWLDSNLCGDGSIKVHWQFVQKFSKWSLHLWSPLASDSGELSTVNRHPSSTP